MRTVWSMLGVMIVGAVLSGCTGGGSDPDGSGGVTVPAGKKPQVAFVTNGIASFWVIAEKGALDAGKAKDVDVVVRMPPAGVVDQKRMCQDLLAQGIDGIAISPIDPDNQGDLLEEIAMNTNLITQDSDAPNSPRLCYVGMDNYTAGRMCGELVKEAMPDGGSVMIFVGRLGQANARLRRQGVIDVLMDREPDSSRYDDPNAGEIKGAKYTVLETRTDGFDFDKAKSQAEDAIAKYEDLGCMVGLFAYNPPLILEAVRGAGKVGQIKIVAFDEDNATLQGITDGSIYGTTVQNPYQYGYKSVEILAELAVGNDSVIPEDKFINIDARNIKQDSVSEFWAELKRLTEDGSPADGGDAASGDATDAASAADGEAAGGEPAKEAAPADAAAEDKPADAATE